jgi:hypothetical protein
MKEKLMKMKYIEYLATIFGACFIAFGLGAVFANNVQFLVLPLILIGIVVHSWGMYKIHQANK